jgi:hypothetical protein
LQYIDDRWIGKKSFSKQSGIDRKKDAQRCLYVVSEVLIRLGYFINIEKSVFFISTVIIVFGNVGGFYSLGISKELPKTYNSL